MFPQEINIVNKLYPDKEIFVNYMDIELFIKIVISEKNILNFTTKRDCKFDKNDFTVRFLCEDEIERLNGYKSMKRQIEWISGRFLVKNMVKEHLSSNYSINNFYSINNSDINFIELDDIKISYKDEGSPFLDKFPSVNISITHSGNYVAAALCSNGKKIGIDIEKIDYKPAKSYESDSSEPFLNSFMKIAFTQREIDSIFLKYKKGGGKGAEIMRRWTIKEAFLKYIGRGFNEKLKSVEVLDDKIVYNEQEVDNIVVSSFNINSNYLLSLIYG